jgi:prepilin signal peptidase PulO-like enzyme (type II secretory pathway)
MNKNLWLRRIRNVCGILGGILPFVAIFSVLLIQGRPAHSLYSISATYYLSPALSAILTAASVCLMTYDGYSRIDNFITTITGVFGIGIVLFPCSVDWIDSMERVGFFQVPMHYSNYVHCACAAIFFILLSFNCWFLFTKTDDFDSVTENKKKRNVIYRSCALVMLFFEIWQVITCNVSFFSGWWTMINEIGLLFAFCIAWITKGGLILKDE